MQVEVLMPKMGESITEGKIVKWHKKPGEKIERDEVLLEISTDKVDTEIPSSATGILTEVTAQEQDTVSVGTVIAFIETDMNGAPKVVPSVKESARQAEHAAVAPPDHPSNGGGGHVRHQKTENKFFSPLVRNIAKAEGITDDELTSLPGSGSGGRITKDDLKRYIEHRESPRQTPSATRMSAGSIPQRDRNQKWNRLCRWTTCGSASWSTW